MSAPRTIPADRRRQTRIGWTLPLASLAVTSLSAVWALRPVILPAIETPRTLAAAEPKRKPQPTLDVDAFRAPLWIVAAPPPAPPQPPPPPPPLRLQLLAILKEGGIYKAAIYDPDADRLFVAGTGETAAGRRVERIGSSSVELKDGNRSSTISLAQGAQP